MAPRRQVELYRLTAATIAVSTENGKDSRIQIPGDSVITLVTNLVGSAEPNRQVEIQWLGRTLRVFAADILECGIRI
jgi:hypothetical protein